MNGISGIFDWDSKPQASTGVVQAKQNIGTGCLKFAVTSTGNKTGTCGPARRAQYRGR